MWALSGFADEAAPSLAGQARVARSAGLESMELRLALGRPVVRWSDRTVARARRVLADAGLRASCVATGIGKTPLGTPWPALGDALRRACSIAHDVGARHIRVFSFTVEPRSEDERLPQAVDRLGELVAIAEAEDVVLLHENEKRSIGSSPARCAALAGEIASPHFRLIFDPANFVRCGHRPATEAYPAIRRWVDYLHVKDAVASTGRVVPAGRGDGELPELVTALVADGFTGVASIEPHLGLGGRGGPSSPRRWREAADAFRALLPG